MAIIETLFGQKSVAQVPQLRKAVRHRLGWQDCADERERKPKLEEGRLGECRLRLVALRERIDGLMELGITRHIAGFLAGLSSASEPGQDRASTASGEVQRANERLVRKREALGPRLLLPTFALDANTADRRILIVGDMDIEVVALVQRRQRTIESDWLRRPWDEALAKKNRRSFRIDPAPSDTLVTQIGAKS